MNIVFFGSSGFAVPSLKALVKAGENISCVVTQPDRRRGRGLRFEGTAVKTAAGEFSLKIYQPENINTDEAKKFLKNLEAELFTVISYGQLLSKGILSIPKIFSVNVHASILPKYRGAAPINRAIINGEKTTGITIIKMTEEMDAGPVILQESLDIKEDDTSISLEDRLSQVAALALMEGVESIKNNNYKLVAQDEASSSLAPKLKKEDGLINWQRPGQSINNLIRGCLTWPGAFTYYKGKLFKIYKSKIIRTSEHQRSRNPGEIIRVSKEGIVVATGKDDLIIEELQVEGKKRMKAEEFIAGHKISQGESLGKK